LQGLPCVPWTLKAVLPSGTPRASELAKALMGFKEIFLVGFFLSIGLSGTPSFDALACALLLLLFLPLKSVFFMLLFTRFHLRARTSFLSSLSLSSYSEFGLIVGGVAVAKGWLSYDWLVILAIAMSISFGLSAVVNGRAQALVDSFRHRLRRFETGHVLPYDNPIDPGDAEIVVFGMGRLGSGAYDSLVTRYGPVVLGIDATPTWCATKFHGGEPPFKVIRRIAISGSARATPFESR